jgi:hypothetical protein
VNEKADKCVLNFLHIDSGQRQGDYDFDEAAEAGRWKSPTHQKDGTDAKKEQKKERGRVLDYKSF